MPIWLSTTTVAALLLLDPGSRALECALQPNAEWSASPEAVSAIVCQGVPGFFVPSPLYRLIRDPTKSTEYRLLDQELQISQSIITESKALDQIRERQLTETRADAEMYRRRYLETLDKFDDASARLVELSVPKWHQSRALWLSVGVALTLTAVAIAERD